MYKRQVDITYAKRYACALQHTPCEFQCGICLVFLAQPVESLSLIHILDVYKRQAYGCLYAVLVVGDDQCGCQLVCLPISDPDSSENTAQDMGCLLYTSDGFGITLNILEMFLIQDFHDSLYFIC